MESLGELINLAQAMLDNGFDVNVFLNWQFTAFIALLAVFGPFHYYTQNFKRLTSAKDLGGLLAGRGVLEAARSLIACAGGKACRGSGSNL